jgi:hypothetical protein
VSKDERIDLKQFEGITKGKWSIIRNGSRIDIGVGTPDAYSPVITFTESLADAVMKIERDVADMNAIAAVPEMIAELKKCYDRIDKCHERIDCLQQIAEDYREERPEEYCTHCYAYISEYVGDGVKECECDNEDCINGNLDEYGIVKQASE